jgi:hypothetical protein
MLLKQAITLQNSSILKANALAAVCAPWFVQTQRSKFTEKQKKVGRQNDRKEIHGWE